MFLLIYGPPGILSSSVELPDMICARSVMLYLFFNDSYETWLCNLTPYEVIVTSTMLTDIGLCCANVTCRLSKLQGHQVWYCPLTSGCLRCELKRPNCSCNCTCGEEFFTFISIILDEKNVWTWLSQWSKINRFLCRSSFYLLIYTYLLCFFFSSWIKLRTKMISTMRWLNGMVRDRWSWCSKTPIRNCLVLIRWVKNVESVYLFTSFVFLASIKMTLRFLRNVILICTHCSFYELFTDCKPCLKDQGCDGGVFTMSSSLTWTSLQGTMTCWYTSTFEWVKRQ